MSEHNYPLSILPQTENVTQMDIDALCEALTLFTIRRSDKLHVDIFKKSGNLREDALNAREIINMSLNLLGGAFKTEHIQFKPTGEASKIWDGRESIVYSQYHNLVEHIPQVIPIFFEVNKLHNIEIPYNRTKEKELSKIISAFELNPMETNGVYQLVGKGVISHEPTRLNYWHVEFQIQDFQKKKIKDISSAWKKEVAESILKNIIKYATSECGEIAIIPESFFIK
jgi:hypothetical protein